MKKFLTTLLCIVMIMAMMPMVTGVAYAEGIPFEGKGSPKNPYLIYDKDDLELMKEIYEENYGFSGKYFKLMNDISNVDFTICTDYDEDKDGTGRWWNGNFDGNGHTIELNITSTNSVYAGLFGHAENVSIKNLNVTGSITASNSDSHTLYVGGIAGQILDSKITNCESSVNIVAEGKKYIDVGGIIGNSMYSSSIENCAYTGNQLNCSTQYYNSEGWTAVGGIVGNTSGSTYVKNSFSVPGSLQGFAGDGHEDALLVGGIVGRGTSELVIDQTYYLENKTEYAVGGIYNSGITSPSNLEAKEITDENAKATSGEDALINILNTNRTGHDNWFEWKSKTTVPTYPELVAPVVIPWWSVDNETKTLTVFCDGPIPDYEGWGNNTAEWSEHDFDTVLIKNSVTSIGAYSFYECPLKEIIFEEGCQITQIGEHAFQYSNIINLEIPESVSVIGEYAFGNCENLKDVLINGENLQIMDYAFEDDAEIDKLKFAVVPISIASNAFYKVKKPSPIENFMYSRELSDIPEEFRTELGEIFNAYLTAGYAYDEAWGTPDEEEAERLYDEAEEAFYNYINEHAALSIPTKYAELIIPENWTLSIPSAETSYQWYGGYFKTGEEQKDKHTPSYHGGYFDYEAYKANLEKLEKEEHEKQVAEAKKAIKNTEFRATSTKQTKLNGKKAIKLKWEVVGGTYNLSDFEGFDVFRSTKKNSGYGKTPFFTTTKWTYVNNKDLKAGKTYYYKVRAWKMVDGEKVYTNWSTKAWRTVK